MNRKPSSINPGNRQKIFLFGGGLHGQCCIDTIEKQGKYELLGIIDSVKDIGSFVDGYEILGRMEDFPRLAEEYHVQAGFIAIGDNWWRKKLVDEIQRLIPFFDFINIIHPSTVLGKNISYGKGIYIGAQCIIGSSAVLGDFCLLHNKAHLGMNNQIGEFASVSGSSWLSGKVKIGAFSAITLMVTVHDRTTIGEHTVIGSCSLVTRDIPDHVIAYGQPARIIRSRKEGEPYMGSG